MARTYLTTAKNFRDSLFMQTKQYYFGRAIPRRSLRRLVSRIPPLEEIQKDLIAVGEFLTNIKMNNCHLSAMTPDIIIEKFNFGPFIISPWINIERIFRNGWKWNLNRVSVKPLKPRYSYADRISEDEEGYIHPHVAYGRLCLGNGRTILTNATADLRILDVFTIVYRIMCSYNRRNAYEEVDEWKSPKCAECNRVIKLFRNAYHCTDCDELICHKCVYHRDKKNNKFCICKGCA